MNERLHVPCLKIVFPVVGKPFALASTANTLRDRRISSVLSNSSMDGERGNKMYLLVGIASDRTRCRKTDTIVLIITIFGQSRCPLGIQSKNLQLLPVISPLESVVPIPFLVRTLLPYTPLQ